MAPGAPWRSVGFVPRDLCSWTYRFDDPKREYRTLYVAQERLTCFLEVFQDLRPNAEAIALYSQMSDAGDGLDEHMAGVLTEEHLANRVLCEAEIQPESAGVLHLTQIPVRQELSRKLDGVSCFVLFENRAFLELRGEPKALTADLPEIQTVCGLFSLRLAQLSPM